MLLARLVVARAEAAVRAARRCALRSPFSSRTPTRFAPGEKSDRLVRSPRKLLRIRDPSLRVAKQCARPGHAAARGDSQPRSVDSTETSEFPRTMVGSTADRAGRHALHWTRQRTL